MQFRCAESEYSSRRRVHLNWYVRVHTEENRFICEYVRKFIPLSYTIGIIFHCRQNNCKYIIEERCKYIVLDKCEGSNKYVLLINKTLLFIFVYVIIGMNDKSMVYNWEYRHVIYIVRGRDKHRIPGLCHKCVNSLCLKCVNSLCLKCVNTLPHMNVHTCEKPFTCTECGTEVYLLPRIRRDTRENKVLHVL